MWNDQLIRYAGVRRDDGTVLGDAANAAFTKPVRRLGWQGPEGPFDIVPLAVETADDKIQLFDLPQDLVLEVAITHQDCPGIADLGLRWHAVTAVAARLGLDTRSEGRLWRDRALVELNVAVLHSFRAAGARISNHHTESRRFLAHLTREQRASSTMVAETSMPVTRNPASASAAATGLPVPEPTSSTRAPAGNRSVSHRNASSWPGSPAKARSYSPPSSSKTSAADTAM